MIPFLSVSTCPSDGLPASSISNASTNSITTKFLMKVTVTSRDTWGALCSYTEEDWFQIYYTAGQTIDETVVYSPSICNLAMTVFDPRCRDCIEFFDA